MSTEHPTGRLADDDARREQECWDLLKAQEDDRRMDEACPHCDYGLLTACTCTRVPSEASS